ncbi:putative efflux protein, MATE family [Pseudoxanthomonas sp. GM95]|uniref:MATE family efflux transporter n=1 Tax=Pseudoxanthomonas sp. GM95 TaxID=1881043 RepID=UPI0008D4E767|nr:MATE family efflux transporter [Pseudoxanthomonas sp. GM95]SEM52065.1 putative efflux protein, MATE family [Pseudoxanthomonas sp. GM95]
MNDKMRTRMLEGPIGRTLMALSVPIILGNLLQTGYQLTDAFWVGRLGASAVAAIALSFPVTFLVIALGSGLAMAGSVLIAQYAGAGRQDRVNHVAGQTMMMVLITSALLGTAGYLLAPSFLDILGVAQNVRDGTLGFMRVSFVGVVFVFAYAMFQALMRGIGQTRLPLLIVLGTVLLNFALDPLFIFGWGPMPGLGVVGAAWATVATQGLAAVVGIVVLLKGRHGIHLEWTHLRPDPGYIRKAFLLGLPGSIDLSTRALGLIVMSYMVAGFGTLPIAAYGIGSTILQVVTIPAAGLSMALSTLVGQHLGAGKVERAMKIARLGIAGGFGMLSILGVVAFVGAPTLVALLVPSDAAAIATGSTFIRTMALSWGGIGVQFCVVAVLRASGQMVQAMIIALVSQWLVQLPLGYVLSTYMHLGAVGIWWSFPTSNLATALLALGWFVRGQWMHGGIAAEA